MLSTGRCKRKVCPRDLHGGSGPPAEGQKEVRVPGDVGRRPPERARAVPDGGGIQRTAAHCDRLPKGRESTAFIPVFWELLRGLYVSRGNKVYSQIWEGSAAEE
jgi:hypothetical protein